MPTPVALPELLIDRSLGRRAVPGYFTEAWPSTVRTIDDVFGLDPVPDAEWMSRADKEGWVVVCKDDRIRRRVGERRLMSQGTLRVFCLVNGQLRSNVQVERFRRASMEMQRQASEPGPWMFGIYADRIEQLTLYS